MYRTSTAQAAFVASLESVAEPIEPKALKQAHGLEALDAAEAEQRLACVQYAVEQENRRLETASALQHALESQTDALTSLQADMANGVAKRIGLIMAHERHGFGMESYAGPRGRTMLRASTEGFKDWFKEFLARLVKLWKQLVAFVKTVVFSRYRKLREARRAIKGTQISKYGLGALLARALSPILVRQAQSIWVTPDGKFDVRGVIANTAKVFHGITDTSYLGKVRDFNQTLLGHTRTLVEAEGNAWRKEAGAVNALEFPMPEGFEIHDREKAKAVWVSLPMVMGLQMRIEGTVAGNVSGARGMEDTAEALASVKVGEFSALPVAPTEIDDVEVIAHATSEAFEDMVKLIDDAIASESRIKPFIDTCEGMTRQIEELSRKAKQSEGNTANFKIAANLLKAAQRSDKLVSSMINKGVEAVAVVASHAEYFYHATEQAKSKSANAQPTAQAA